MRWLLGLAAAAVWLLPWVGSPASEPDVALEEARGRLVESTRDYRLSLERLLATREAAAGRATDEAVRWQRLLDGGMVSRREAEARERAAAVARDLLEETRRRLSETDAALAEILAASEEARTSARTEIANAPVLPHESEVADGTAPLIARLEEFFRLRFARPLPVSARGQTALHDRLRLDHHHAVDVSVHPDSEEGRALVEYLLRNHIPFLSFRGFIPGSSTGAHVHVGRASSRVIRAGTDGR
jgi:hypothetical protein